MCRIGMLKKKSCEISTADSDGHYKVLAANQPGNQIGGSKKEGGRTIAFYT